MQSFMWAVALVWIVPELWRVTRSAASGISCGAACSRVLSTRLRGIITCRLMVFGLALIGCSVTSDEQGAYWSYLAAGRSEEHTSELQSRGHLVCRLLLEKKKH